MYKQLRFPSRLPGLADWSVHETVMLGCSSVLSRAQPYIHFGAPDFKRWTVLTKPAFRKRESERPRETISRDSSQGAKGGVWNGGGWNRQISGPEIYFSGPEFSSKIPCFAG